MPDTTKKPRKVSVLITTTDTSLLGSAVDFVVAFAGGVSTSLFMAWFNDRLRKKKTTQKKIKGVKVSGKFGDVQTETSKNIGCNHRTRKKNKKK